MQKNQTLMPCVVIVLCFWFSTNAYSNTHIDLTLSNELSESALLMTQRDPMHERDLHTWVSKQAKPWDESEESLSHTLSIFHNQFPNYHDRLRALAYWRLGTPYQIFNLGEEQEPDLDPIFRLDVSDCTSHILTTMALAESYSWQGARDTLIQIHYKPDEKGQKKPDYAARWHFTADRLLHHPMTPHVSGRYIDNSKLKNVTLTLNEKQDGSEFLDIGWSKTVNVDYIPSAHVSKELLAKLPSMIGIAFVKESYFDMGLVMAHEGMLIDAEKLLHAGQVAKETVIEDFMTYYFTEDGARFDGIMLYELHPLNRNDV